MKSAICSAGPDPESPVHGHFSSAPWLLLHDDATGKWESVKNAGGHVEGQCSGGRIARMLSSAGVQALVTGQCGAGALASLRAAGITVYRAEQQNAAQAVEALGAGQLVLLASACAHHSHQHGGGCGHHQ
jgi:predicted Fe-Mo cluster-binding NifX family protein